LENRIYTSNIYNIELQNEKGTFIQKYKKPPMRNFITLLLCLLSIVCTSQNINNKFTKISYHKLPESPLPDNYKTYSYELNNFSTILRRIGLSEASLLNSNLYMNRYERVGRNGDISFDVRIDNMNIISERIRQRVSKTKDKNGTQITRIFYYLYLEYSIPMSILSRSKSGKIIRDNNLTHSGSRKSYKHREYESSRQAADSWRIDRTRVLGDLSRRYIENELKKYGNKMRDLYDFVPSTGSPEFFIIRKKNNKNYERYERAFLIVDNAFKKISHEGIPENMLEKISVSLDFWYAQLQKLSRTHKDQKKLYYACAFNLASAYYWLEDFDKAEKYLLECQSIDYKESNTKSWVSKLQKTRSKLEKNGLSSRHFIIEQESSGESENALIVVGNEKSGLINGDNLGYVVWANGDTTQGVFKINTDVSNELDFGHFGNVKFTYIDRFNMSAERILDPNRLNSFSFQNREFYIQDFMDIIGSEDIEKKKIVEKIFESQKIKLYKIYPFAMIAKSQSSTHFIMNKKKDQNWTRISASNFSLDPKKSFSNFFSDCPDLKKAILEGEFDLNSQASYLRLAKTYENICP
jgi:hypothetical protein